MKKLIMSFLAPISFYLIIFLAITFLLLYLGNKAFDWREIVFIPGRTENAKVSSASPGTLPDMELQKPIPDPPKIIKAIYLTSWSAGNPKKIDYAINLAKAGGINAVVIDIKDFSGYVAYDAAVPELSKYGAKDIRIKKINSLIKKLHDAGIYAIARVTVFQDPVLARARPELGIQSRRLMGSSTPSAATLWLDKKKLAWVDPAAREVWDYNLKIVKDAVSRGFDEINFDYIRFPADGNLDDMKFPVWDEVRLARLVIKDFFKYLRNELPSARISADLFGLSTVEKTDLGIGQVIESAYEYFDFVSPMVYPSHYSLGFQGFSEPAAHPYEIVKYSLDNALERLKNYESGIMNKTTSTITARSNSSFITRSSKIRPWLQDFTLRGVLYDTEKVGAEIKAVHDALGENFNGFMVWNPSNVYTTGALGKE